MHELSIAMSLIDVAAEQSAQHDAEVVAIHLRLGPLSGVVKSALLGAFEMAREGTALASAKLVIVDMPVIAWCPQCQREQRIESIQQLCCPMCQTPTPEVRSGRELEVTGLEIVDVARSADPDSDPPPPTRPPTTRMVEVRQKVLKQNDVGARELRQRFAEAGVFVVSLVSSPGAGKTAFLQELLTRLRRRYRVAALVGDLATDNDAERLARSGAAVRQITTGTVCHLEAEMVRAALEGWNLAELDFLFIENVGNLVCPASYDLGENLRLVLFSVTEGEDKPLKYPTIFNTADVAIITKSDLAAAVEFDGAAARRSIDSVRPGMPVFELSTKSGHQMDPWIAELERRFEQSRAAARVERKEI